MKKFIHNLLLILGILFLIYYFACGFMVTFSLSILWIWLVGGLLLLWGTIYYPKHVLKWKKNKLFRTLRKIVIVFMSVGFLAFFIVEARVVGSMNAVPKKPVDCIIVLGAKVNDTEPSLALRDRINAAYEYLNKHENTIVIASGGKGDDEGISEAKCISNELIKKGISKDRIILEDKSSSTAENIQNSKKLLPKSCKSVAIVTNNFHVFRAVATGENYLDCEVYGLSDRFSNPIVLHYMVREFVTFWADTARGNISLSCLI